jgi:hypothetical protein
MKSTVPRLITLVVAAALALARFAAGAPPTADYELLFAEEFDGDRVNVQDWSFRTGLRTGTGINGLNLAANVVVADGHLVIAAKQETVNGRVENTGGGLIGKHRFGFGYYECRSQPFMGGRGVHSAFWQRGLGEENNAIFEIDSYELDSTSRIASNNLYVDVSPSGFMDLAWPHRANVPLTLPADGWFIDAYEYTPEGVVFYDHGRVVARVDLAGLVAAQNIWLTALNGVGTVDAARLPGVTRFDYFRYYARDYPGVNLLANGGFEYNQEKFDPQRPVAWTEEGDVTAARVFRGRAAHGDYKLRHESSRSYAVRTAQTLQFIRNGDYELRARVRRGPGQTAARLRVSDYGGADLTADLPLAELWTDLRLPLVPVANHRVTVTVESAGGGAGWLEVDEIQFLKPPPPGHAPRPTRSFAPPPTEPIWQLAGLEPITFSGDDKFYFFGRNVGYGDAVTVAFIMKPGANLPMIPLARLPATGDHGWGVGLAEGGDLFFRLGSHATHGDVVVRGAWRPGVAVRVTCVFDRGTAQVYVDGVLKQTATVARFAPRDATAAGVLGANSGQYRAVGDVTLGDDAPPPQSLRYRPYVGSLGDVRIFNRALGASEIAALPNPVPTIVMPPASTIAPDGSTVALCVDAAGFPAPRVQWRRNGLPLAGATSSTLVLPATPATAGTYSVAVANSEGSVTSADATLATSDGTDFGRLTNLSVLAELPAAGDAGAFTLGYVVALSPASPAKSLFVRAAGPSLGPFGVQGGVLDPKLELFAGATAAGGNDNWGGGAALVATAAAVGAFPFHALTSLDAATVVTAATPDNSARISATGPGWVLAEIYDLSSAGVSAPARPRLINASVQKTIDAGGSLTAGFVIGGSNARTVLVRAVGPSLGGFGVPGTMSDPQLTLHGGGRVLAQNDDWDGSADLSAAMARAGAFALPRAATDAVLLRTLPPGAYTAEVKAASAGGVALIEIYEVP